MKYKKKKKYKTRMHNGQSTVEKRAIILKKTVKIVSSVHKLRKVLQSLFSCQLTACALLSLFCTEKISFLMTCQEEDIGIQSQL